MKRLLVTVFLIITVFSVYSDDIENYFLGNQYGYYINATLDFNIDKGNCVLSNDAIKLLKLLPSKKNDNVYKYKFIGKKFKLDKVIFTYSKNNFTDDNNKNFYKEIEVTTQSKISAKG